MKYQQSDVFLCPNIREMKPSDYQKLEADKNFKRHYMNKTLWWKSFLLLAPACLLFIGLAGIMYMAYNERLWTLYSVPYILVFALGTVWLKAIKKYIQDRLLRKLGSYLACAGKSLGNYQGRYYFIFCKDSKRHNELLINSLSDHIKLESLSSEQLSIAKKAAIEIETAETDSPIYLKAFSVSKVLKTNRENISEGITPLLYISAKDVFVIRNKDLK